MIGVNNKQNCDFKIVYVYEKPADSKNNNNEHIPAGIEKIFDCSYKSCFPYVNGIKDNAILYVGLGECSSFKLTKIKDIVAYSIKQLKKYKAKNVAIDLSLFLKEFGIYCIGEVVLGIRLGLYNFKGYTTSKEKTDYDVFLKGYSQEEEYIINVEKNLALNLSEGVILARNLVNTPANRLTPIIMAENIRKLGEDAGFQVEIFDEKYIVENGMDAFYTVGGSSGNPPRLIIARYFGDDESEDITALVGKGVTCDTGGYCLKPGSSMAGIKGDMAGAAAVIGTIYALAKNKVKANVVVVIPACENRVSRESFIPGDVINSMSGKTIEILNTDAEGRLILADAITYALQKEKAGKVIDIATLTGAVVNALGFNTAGVLTNNKEFYQEFKKGYKKSGEQYFQFPIYDEYRDMIKSDIADVKNVGKNYCGTITAGLFIEKFVEDTPWIHLDIAGTAWLETPLYEYQATGATGAGVTSMYHLFSERK
ncbi:leucyl aminopeptidase [Clostridium estertheticum]|uniref:leucyl aminopeptidase n=1 Tax=Clostridium estertheticum TaxID=238834 RepID=UPI0013E94CE2|nr:leucyl aminopeptidase [Clostridium estertheticum]MBZ9686906.1 leucyl aminopeptidase [Clostridium estertheticum]